MKNQIQKQNPVYLAHRKQGNPNVHPLERVGSVLGGGALLAYGLRQRGLKGLLAIASGAGLLHRGIKGHCYVYEALGINTAQTDKGPAPRASVALERGVKFQMNVRVERPPKELYQYWRNFGNLPRIMRHLQSVVVTGHQRFHWVARAPLGRTVEWDAEIITDRPNEFIGWRSLPGADVPNAGSVHFEPTDNGRGTLVKVYLKYDPPAGAVGAALASLFGENPEQQLREDLLRFKEAMEQPSQEPKPTIPLDIAGALADRVPAADR